MVWSDLRVCLCPLDIKWGNKEANLSALEKIAAQVHPDTDLLILPETFSTGFPSAKEKDDVRPLAERNTGQTIDFVKKIAARHKIAICGSYIADSGGSLYNRAFFIEPSGDETFADKRHLFTMAKENDVFSKGYDRLKVRYRGWNIAMVICYDVRFPVWCRNRDNEYDILIAVANWPKQRSGAWQKLLPARAIENLAYVCAVNCKGRDVADFEYGGESAVIDFKGNDIGIESTGFIYASLSEEKLSRFREKFPAHKDADSFRLD